MASRRTKTARITEIRCIGCGKLIESGGKTYQIMTGKSEEAGFAPGKEFGLLHEACFQRTVETPKVTLDALRRMAKAGAARLRNTG